MVTRAAECHRHFVRHLRSHSFASVAPQNLSSMGKGRTLPYRCIEGVRVHSKNGPPSGSAVPAACANGPLSLSLRAPGCAAANCRLGPIADPLRRSKRHHYSITSSARSRNDSGMVMLIAFAVFRLITSSNFVGCSTGRSAGLVPCKILCTYPPPRRNRSGRLAP
jgi:hypothetical protein